MTLRQHLHLSLYWLANNLIWGALLGPVLSTQVAVLVPKASAEALGILVSLAAIPAIIIPLIAGPISDRCRSPYGRRSPFILGGGLIAILGLCLMSLAALLMSFPFYVAAFVVVQIGVNTALAAYSAIIPDQVQQDQRGTASAFMAVFSNAGTMIGLALAAAFGSRWFTEFALAGLLASMLVVFLAGLREKPFVGDPLKPLTLEGWLKSLWIDPRKYPDFAWVWITRALMMLGFYMIQPFLLYYLRDLVGVSDPGNETVIVLASILVVASFSAYFIGKVSDKVGRIPCVRISALVVAVAAIAFPFMHSLAQALSVGLVFGAGYGAYFSVDWALGTEVLPNQSDAAKDLGVWHIAMVLPQQLGALLAGNGILAFFHGPTILFKGKMTVTYLPGGYFILFLVAAGFFALSGLLITKVRGVR